MDSQNQSGTTRAVRTSLDPAVGVRDMTGRRNIAALFHNRSSAERAIQDLRSGGFSGDQIGIAMRDRTEQGHMVEDTGASNAAAGAGTGLLGGGLLGGIVGLLVGVGALAIPGIGPVVAGGVLATTFGLAGGTAVAGAGIGAAIGGVTGALVGLGFPEAEAEHFETGMRGGHILVTVMSNDRTMDALAILERNGGDTGARPGVYNDGSDQAVGVATGAVAGGVTGGVLGAVVGGPIGGVAGAAAGAAIGTAMGGASDNDDEWVVDRAGNRVRRTTL